MPLPDGHQPDEQTLNLPHLPTVSVVIPIFNGEEDLPELLDCLQKQTYPVERVEYLLIDNNSRDRTLASLEAAVRASGSQGWRLRCLREAQIQSSYAARNTGIKAAEGTIIAFTDADCRPEADWLYQLIQPFVDAQVGIVAGEVVALPGATLLEQFADRRETLSQKHTLAHSFYPYGQTANLAIRRSILEKVGLFRPYLTTGGDADLCWRIQMQSNWQIYFAEQAIVKHRHRSTLKALRRQWHRYGESNQYLHQLYGVSLMRELSRKDYLYRWSRWLLKEVPMTVKRIIIQRADASSLLDTPIALLCSSSRSQGQREAVLSEAAQQIEWLSSPPPDASKNGS
jgi:cellulose synthase/poly-beta-1,6-N-acetylglucosamine synthase-like glycosyltransferase